MRSPSFVLLPSCFFFLNTTRSAQGQNTKENGVNSSRRDQARFSSSFLLAAKAKTSSSSSFWISDTKFSLKTQQAAQSLMRWKKKWSHYPKLGLNHHSEIVLSRLLRTIINAGGKGSLAKRKERPSNNKKLLAPPIVVRHNKKSMPSSGNLESAKNRRKFLEKGKKMRQTRLACGSARRGRLSHYRIVSKRSQTVFVSNKRRKRAQTQTEGGGRRAEPWKRFGWTVQRAWKCRRSKLIQVRGMEREEREKLAANGRINLRGRHIMPATTGTAFSYIRTQSWLKRYKLFTNHP